MYKLAHVAEDINKFNNTWVGVNGKLTEVGQIAHVGGGQYSLVGTQMDWKTRIPHPIELRVRDGDISWLPPLLPGYYNFLNAKPWMSLWMEQSAKRQYKVGLNNAIMRYKDSFFTYRGRGVVADHGPGFPLVAHAFEHGPDHQEVGKAINMVRKRNKNATIGLSLNLALDKGPMNIVYLIYRARRVVGMVNKKVLYVDATFTHPDLNNMEYKNAEIEEMRKFLTQASRAGRNGQAANPRAR